MIEFTRVNPKEVLSAQGLQDLDALLQIEAVKTGLMHGGWIAGGAVRALLCGEPLKTYFAYRDGYQSGDIDIFFPSTEDANLALKSLSRYASRSYGGNATQLTDSLIQNDCPTSVTVQYVDNQDFCNPEITFSLQRFDFVNCMVAFDGRSIIMPKGWHDLETCKLLRIHNVHSPYLATRLKKYVKYRGYKGISADSRDAFTEWLVKSLDVNNFASFGKSAPFALEKVKEIGHLMTGEDLLLFIGKWTTVEQHKSYGHMFEEKTDWALSQIQKTSTNSCSNPSI